MHQSPDTTSVMREALEKIVNEHWTCSASDLKQIARAALTAPAGFHSAGNEPGNPLAPAQADIHATTDDVLRKIHDEARRRKIENDRNDYAQTMKNFWEFVAEVAIEYAHSPTPPRVDEKEMRELLAELVLSEKAKQRILDNCLGGEVFSVDEVLVFGRSLMEKCK